MNYYV